jgi:excisionase family DNA binding protein
VAKKKGPTTGTSSPAIQPRMLVVKDAATYLGVGPWAVRKLHWDGVLRGIFIGRRLLFDKLAIDKYIDGLVRAAA